MKTVLLRLIPMLLSAGLVIAAALLFLPALHWTAPHADALALFSPTPVQIAEMDQNPKEAVRLSPFPHNRKNERWKDVGGVPFSNAFAATYDYAAADVRVTYLRTGTSFAGWLDASGLKPNFAYQIKLRGDYKADPSAHSRIGYTGRWRLPGTATNFSDDHYLLSSPKEKTESYILFDYFVTDDAGCAHKPFCLSSSLHVLWNDVVNESPPRPNTPARVILVSRKREAYNDAPTPRDDRVQIWAENEGPRNSRAPLGHARLPEGSYLCSFVLTEESFHDLTEGGGYWATVLTARVSFSIVDAVATSDSPPDRGSDERSPP